MTRIRIGNLTPKVDEGHLQKVLSHTPGVVRIERAGAEALVAYESAQQAADAAHSLDGRWCKGANLMARIDRGAAATRFHNPYTFVPTPPRKWPDGSFAADADPRTRRGGLVHNRLAGDKWTGAIPFKVIVVTPLLLLGEPTDPPERETRGRRLHRKYSIVDRPEASSIRGVLRSAYETITNSRYGCFTGHDRPIGYRATARTALDLRPVVMKSTKGKEGLRAVPFDDFARLPYWGSRRVLFPDGSAPVHNEPVWAEVVRCRQFWDVVAIWRRDSLAEPPAEAVAPPDRKVVKGRVFITNENIEKKHDERVFFWKGKVPLPLPFAEGVDGVGRWKARILDYRDQHSDADIFERPGPGGGDANPWEKVEIRASEPGKTVMSFAWSPHQYVGRKRDAPAAKNPDPLHRQDHDWAELREGDLAWARLDASGTSVVDLLPVQISRELNEAAPAALLGESLLPADTIDRLSPTDRLFGWVAPRGGEDKSTSWKGRVRVIVPHDAVDERSVVKVGDADGSLPLPILGKPKPAQGRFYVASDKSGKPYRGGPPFYAEEGVRGLRGRKHYPHHRLAVDWEGTGRYWRPAGPWPLDPDPRGRYPEYVRAGLKRDPQNRSITSWIAPGAVFRGRIEVLNLEAEELGALLWLLNLPADHYFRLGYGKPVGFGSVRIEVDKDACAGGKLPLAKGDAWTAVSNGDEPPSSYYRSLLAAAPATLGMPEVAGAFEGDAKELVSSFQEAMAMDGVSFEEQPFVKGFLAVSHGLPGEIPTHYPRKSVEPDPDGRNFEWFKSNEAGAKDPLPYVTDGSGLPYKP